MPPTGYPAPQYLQSGRVRAFQMSPSLSPFATWPALPASDYYEDSVTADLPTIGHLESAPDTRRLRTDVAAGPLIIRSGFGFKQCSFDRAGRGSPRGRLIDSSFP
jgi:hypothetical protein